MASLTHLVDDLKKSFNFFAKHPLLSSSPYPPPHTTTSSSPTTNYAKFERLFSQLLEFAKHAVQDPSSAVTQASTFLQNPRIDGPSYLISVVCVLAAVFVTMSWFSRQAGRFSPFGRPNASSNNEVNDSDFSYITKEDLDAQSRRRHRASSRAAAPEIVDWDDKNPDRDTDILVFKLGRVSYPTHFPAQSIQDGELTIGTVRQAAAKKLNVTDPRRIRLFFKGRQLKHDDELARDEGLRGDGTGSEILCVVGELSSGGLAPGFEDSNAYDNSRLQVPSDRDDLIGSDDDEDDTEGVSDSIGGTASGKKKPRKRGGKKRKGKKGGPASSTSELPYTNSTPAAAEFLPLPSQFNTPRPTSAPPAPKPAQAGGPQTAIQKMDAIASKFHTELVPLCVSFIGNPPSEKKAKEFEHKKLTETILAQVLLKLDGVETEGDPDARNTRKALVKEVQSMLGKLDEVVK